MLEIAVVECRYGFAAQGLYYEFGSRVNGGDPGHRGRTCSIGKSVYLRVIVVWLSSLLVLFFLLFLSGTTAFGQPLPQSGSSTGVTTQLQPVVSGLSSPVLVTNAKDLSNRLFILE